jgi:hypothetical protein
VVCYLHDAQARNTRAMHYLYEAQDNRQVQFTISVNFVLFNSDFCKQLSKKEALGEASSESEREDHHSSGSDAERPFHHPFQIKERPSSIVMNIRVSVQGDR